MKQRCSEDIKGKPREGMKSSTGKKVSARRRERQKTEEIKYTRKDESNLSVLSSSLSSNHLLLSSRRFIQGHDSSRKESIGLHLIIFLSASVLFVKVSSPLSLLWCLCMHIVLAQSDLLIMNLYIKNAAQSALTN